MGMKRRISIQTVAMQAASAQTCQETYLPFREGLDLLLFYCTGFTIKVTTTGKRGAESHAISIAGVVIVVIAVVVDIHEVSSVVR